MVLRVYHTRHVAALLGVSKATVYRLIDRGELPYTTLYDGGDYIFLPEWIDALVEKRAAKKVYRNGKNCGSHKS